MEAGGALYVPPVAFALNLKNLDFPCPYEIKNQQFTLHSLSEPLWDTKYKII